MDAGLTAGVLGAAPGEINRLVAVAHLGVAGPLRRAVLVARVEPEGAVHLLLHERRAREVERLGQRHPVRVSLDVGLTAPDFEALNLRPGEDVANAKGDLADERGKVPGLKVHGSPLPQTRNRPDAQHGHSSVRGRSRTFRTKKMARPPMARGTGLF